MAITGACHCGNLRFEIETAVPADEIVARACDCRFCRIHGAKTWSDPDGRARLTVTDPAHLQRYRFALATADFFLCNLCGAYAGAVLSSGGRSWSTLNLRLTDLAGAPATAARYSGETSSERVARRMRAWTPTEVEGVNRASLG